jgi:hypothetical protein
LARCSAPIRDRRGTEWPSISKLEHEDGTPADPPTLHTAVPNWSPGDTIPLGHRTLRVIDVRDESDGVVLVVE